MVEHSSTNPKVPGSIPGPVSYGVMDYDEACFMHLTPGVVIPTMMIYTSPIIFLMDRPLVWVTNVLVS